MPIRVLIVDDSALMRQILTELLSRDADIEVVDTASDPLIARDRIKQHNPDVITLDIEMPRMNGLDFLRKLMALRPTPVVMISSLTQSGADAALEALQIGAFDIVGKPDGILKDGMQALAEEIIAKIKAAATSRRLPSMARAASARVMNGRSGSGGTIARRASDGLFAIGASTGGIPVVEDLLEAMPEDCPPILVVQHMPPNFTPRLAARLNGLCAIEVCEARDGQPVKPGHAYIAPGGRMMRLEHSGGERRLRITEEARYKGFCPSVDILFQTVAALEGSRSTGVLLTGMGKDGAEGLLAIRKAGGLTLAQDEASCVVYGMPRVAVELHAVCAQKTVGGIADTLISRAWAPMATEDRTSC